MLGLGAVLQPRDDVGDLVAEPALGIHHQRDHVGALGPVPRRGDHRPVEAAFGREDAGGIDQQYLRVTLDRDAEQAGARGLRLRADDRDLLADQAVDQRRLARVGRADDGDQPAMLLLGFTHVRRR